jgi:anti-repressor protein
MNDGLQIFDYQSKEIRVTLDEQGEPWWVAKDVCEILEIKNSRQAVSKLDDDEKGVILNDTLGGPQDMAIVNEPGLYRLIMQSRKKEAREFQRWIAHDVLPQIRRTGQYSALVPKTFSEALMLAGQLQAQVEEKEKQLAIAAPKVREHDLFMDGSNYKTMNAVAKALGTGRTRLFKLLRDKGVLTAKNLPYQRYLELGYFVLKERPITMGEANINYSQVFVTAKGESWLSRFLVYGHEA